MMSLTAIGLLALLEVALVNATEVGFGPYFSFGSTSSWVRESVTTLVLPQVPSPAADRLALWPGMGTSDGDLIQAIAVATLSPETECGGKTGQWCIFASVLESYQEYGTELAQDAGTALTIHYKYNDSTRQYDQTVSIDDLVVSSISTTSGQATGYGTAVECQEDACYSTVNEHQYLNTTVILDSADPNFGGTVMLNEAESSPCTTTDGGVTWVVTTINIHQHTFTGA